MYIACCCVDSGYAAQVVYSFTKPRELRRVYASKGYAGSGRAMVSRPTRGIKFKAALFPLGVDSAKDLIYNRLKIETPGAGYCHFPSNYDLEYFLQLTAERRIVKYRYGRPYFLWVPKRARNEVLDCRVGALCALEILRPDLDKLAEIETPIDFRQRPMAKRRRVLSRGV